MISNIVYLFFKIIYLVIIAVVLLSWIPVINREKEPVVTLIKIYTLIMQPFRFIPPIGMIDISPLVAFIILQLIEQLLYKILIPLGL